MNSLSTEICSSEKALSVDFEVVFCVPLPIPQVVSELGPAWGSPVTRGDGGVLVHWQAEEYHRPGLGLGGLSDFPTL